MLGNLHITPNKSASAKCAWCPRDASYYVVNLDDILSGAFVCTKHVDRYNADDRNHPKDQRPDEGQSSDAAHRPETP